MYSEMLAQAHMASISRELEAQRWVREWRATRRIAARSETSQSPPPGAKIAACPSAGATLPEGR